jgi:hypothetical protein
MFPFLQRREKVINNPIKMDRIKQKISEELERKEEKKRAKKQAKKEEKEMKKEAKRQRKETRYELYVNSAANRQFLHWFCSKRSVSISF